VVEIAAAQRAVVFIRLAKRCPAFQPASTRPTCLMIFCSVLNVTSPSLRLRRGISEMSDQVVASTQYSTAASFFHRYLLTHSQIYSQITAESGVFERAAKLLSD
jgi:hypothetical protein